MVHQVPVDGDVRPLADVIERLAVRERPLPAFAARPRPLRVGPGLALGITKVSVVDRAAGEEECLSASVYCVVGLWKKRERACALLLKDLVQLEAQLGPILLFRLILDDLFGCPPSPQLYPAGES